MLQFDVNYLAVLVSAIVGFFIGMLWYSLLLFGKMWMGLVGLGKKELEKEKQKSMVKSMVMAFVAVLVMSYVLAFFVDTANATSIVQGAKIGFWIWLGFIATVMLGMILWENKPCKLYLLNVSHYLVVLVVMGAILAVWT
jgi:hypothetical protein